MATKSVQMGAAKIGPQCWRSNTLNEIKLSNDIVKKSDQSCMMGRSKDPLPNLREVVAGLSNDEAHRYFRQTRAVVCLLRESLIDTNEEIKSLTRSKEGLEKALEHIRKDLVLNNDCKSVRSTRPQREKEHDGADDMLNAERMQLLNLKKMLESQLQLVQNQLQTLDCARRRLSNVVQERSRVIDLICAGMPSGGVSQSAMGASTTRPGGSCGMKPIRSLSASLNGRASMDLSSSPQIDPLGPYTPEADAALNDAREARARSNMLRKQADNLINNVNNVQQGVHRGVNMGLTGKVAETVGLKQNLDVTAGQNRHACNRAQRWFDSTEKAWLYSRGPANYENLTVRERLDRPVIKVFQRHPGNTMPEAQHIVRGGDGLLESLHKTSSNIGMLRLAHLKLKDDIRDKKAAIDCDSSIVRMRRRKGNHRWTVGQAF